MKNNSAWTSFKILRTTNKGNLYFINDKSPNINNDESDSDDENINNNREISNLLYKKENYEIYKVIYYIKKRIMRFIMRFKNYCNIIQKAQIMIIA